MRNKSNQLFNMPYSNMHQLPMKLNFFLLDLFWCTMSVYKLNLILLLYKHLKDQSFNNEKEPAKIFGKIDNDIN